MLGDRVGGLGPAQRDAKKGESERKAFWTLSKKLRWQVFVVVLAGVSSCTTQATAVAPLSSHCR